MGNLKQNIISPDSRDEFDEFEHGNFRPFFPSFLPSFLQIHSHKVETLVAPVVGSKQAPLSQFILISL